MNEEIDIRWKQRYSNYQKAINQLTKFIEKENLNELEDQGLIQSFEYTHELAWNVMKDFLQYEGIQNIVGSRSATREAYNKGLIENGQEWMNMIESRNRTVHIYEESVLKIEKEKIIENYFPLFIEFYKEMKKYL